MPRRCSQHGGEPISQRPARILFYLKPYRLEIAATLFSVLVVVGINLSLPYLMRLVIDGLTDQTLQQPELVKILAGYFVLGTIAAIFSRLLRRIPLKLSHKAEYHLRRDVFSHLTSLDQQFYRAGRTGDLVTRLSSDINMVRDAIGQGLLQGIRTAVVLGFALIVMMLTDVLLAGIVFALCVPMVGIFFLILRVMRGQQKDLQEHVSEVSSFAQESFAGIRCIKGFGIEKRRSQQFETLNDGLVAKNMKTHISRQSLWPFMAFWFGLGTILILNIGGRRIISGELTLGTLTQFIQYLLYMQWPLLALSWTSSLYQRGVVSWNRIKAIMESKPEIREPRNPRTEPITDASIHFNNVDFSIEGHTLLHGINLKIPAGTTLGIAGPTGSGKTLLASLVARVADPTSGSVTIGGADIRSLPLAHLRSLLGYAAQETVLFSYTLEHNLGFGIEPANDEIVRWATDTAHLQADVDNFPEGFSTLVGERGVRLSGGQRQRTAIARAIARRPDILILDDVLSAVDTQTEAAIMRKLKPLMETRTTLFISHRISTLRYANEIIVIEDGHITQRGTHDELLSAKGYYAEINTMQQLQQQLEADA